MPIDWSQALMSMLALIIAIPVHEFAHALSAVNNGDDGPRRDGRLSIMPWDHFDPIGFACCVITTITGFGIGWGKPVMVNPNMLRNPRWDMCKIAAWGPFSNFLLAVGFALPLRFGWVDPVSQGGHLLTICILVNLGLLCFNLIPVGPLDGAKVVAAFLPDAHAHAFSTFMARYGMLLLLGLITLGRDLVSILVGVPAFMLYVLLVGPVG